ncbi:unnamed protein product, partial [Musa banksii]
PSPLQLDKPEADSSASSRRRCRSLPRRMSSRSPAWTTRWSSRWATRITSTSAALWWAASPTRTQACSSCSASIRGVRWRSLTVCGEGGGADRRRWDGGDDDRED